MDQRARTAVPAPPRPWSGGGASRRDLMLAGVVLVLQLGLSLAFAHRHHAQGHLDPGAWVLLVVGPLSLVVWRRYPVAVLWVTFVATLGPSGARFAYLSLIVAFFLCATGDHRRAAWVVIVVGYVASLWLAPLVWGQPFPSPEGALALGGWLAVLVVAAEVVRMRRERLAESRAVRQAEVRRRASEERLQMARDLHDVIGHTISLINVQAAAGLDLMDSRPEQARAALVAIKGASKDALGELRNMLAALREDGDAAPRSPAPGLDRLDELVALTAAAGLRVTTWVRGPARPLPATVDLTAYRIVQESLTNVARHAQGATADVTITYEPQAVVIAVTDDGGAGAPDDALPAGASHASHGTGIAGMQERAAALGGQVHAGPRPGGGFRVVARLPSTGLTEEAQSSSVQGAGPGWTRGRRRPPGNDT